MSVESPETYGEHYWHSQLEAATAFEEEMEKGMVDFVTHPFADPELREAVPFDILNKWDNLFSLKSQAAGRIAGSVLSSTFSNVENTVTSVAMRPLVYAANKLHRNEFIDVAGVINQFRHGLWDGEFAKSRLSMYGYSELEVTHLLQSTKSYPSVPEIVRWGRYQEFGRNLWTHIDTKYVIEESDRDLWEFLTQQQFSTDQILNLYKRGKVEQGYMGNKLEELGWFGGHIADLIELSYVIPNAMLTMQGNLHAGIGVEKIFEDLGHADIHPNYHQKYYDAVLTKPSSIDLISYHLRQENDLADLDGDLRRIGIHPDYFDIYRTLANRLPPVADIITMAVREAFNPSIAARFGQYEDFPREFGQYAQQQGLSQEWAERYWAAHWGLPSPQQGFEMLHRGVINRSDLELLMKAQDIMPFWREKMVDIAYRPLTRVDVRRMYKEGILDETGVYQAYQDAGYSDENAEAMTEFTISYVLTQQSKFTTADVVSAYTKRMIDKSEARSLLNVLGVRSQDATYILGTADYKREWALTDAKTGAIRNLYKRGEYTESQARTELLRLDLPTVQVETLMETWWYERKEDRPNTWTKAETFKYLKAELITIDRAKQELQTMGYDEEHITVYMRAGKWQS